MFTLRYNNILDLIQAIMHVQIVVTVVIYKNNCIVHRERPSRCTIQLLSYVTQQRE
jgi:hypothetical protein